MLQPHERELLNHSRSEAAETRVPTAIAAYVVWITVYGFIHTNDVTLKWMLTPAIGVTVFYLVLNGYIFFSSQLTVMQLTMRSKKVEMNFHESLDRYKLKEFQEKK